MPEPRDYAADPSCSSRCLYLPCYLSITSTPSDWRKSTRLSPSFLLGRAFSTWERGPASRPWNSSAAVSTLLRLRSPTRTMQRSASSRSRITMAGPSPWRCQHRRRFLVERAGARCRSCAHARRNPTRAGARRELSPRPSDPHLAALVHDGVLPRGDLVFRVLAAAAFSAGNAARRRTAATAGSLVPNRTAYGRPLPAPTTR